MSDFNVRKQQHSKDLAHAIEPSLADFSLNKAQLKQLQLRKLRHALQFAKVHSPWHHQRLKNINCETMQLSDFSSIPVMSKDEVMNNWDEIVTTNELSLTQAKQHLGAMQADETTNPYYKNQYLIQASGGSSGNPIVIPYSWQEWIQLYLGFSRPGILAYQNSNIENIATDIHTATLGTNKLTHMSCLLAKTFTNPQVINHRFDSSQPIEQIVDKLNQIKPSFLTGYASMLYQIAQQALIGNLHIAPIKVFSSTEPLYPYMAQAIEQAWNIAPGNSYVSTESGCIAWSCSKTNAMHLNEDMHYIEPQTDGSIVISNLAHHTLPLIRYHLSDIVNFSHTPCPCGTAHATITSVGGRLSDQFSYSNGVTIAPKLFLRLISPIKQILDFQIKQSPNGADIAVIIHNRIDLEILKTKVYQMFIENGLTAPLVNIQQVNNIPKTKLGKSPKFIALTR